MAAHEEALQMQTKLLGQAHVDVGETYTLLGDVLAFQKENPEEAHKYYTTALKIYKDFFNEDNEKLEELRTKIADCQKHI